MFIWRHLQACGEKKNTQPVGSRKNLNIKLTDKLESTEDVAMTGEHMKNTVHPKTQSLSLVLK